MKRKLSPQPCVRCQRQTSRRREGRPACLRCWVVLTGLEMDKKMRRMGKLKGTHGRS
ncbi:MAG: hypothetical protein ABSA48_09110 [Terracidiphilus sp.]|jgi:hypothetical protein